MHRCTLKPSHSLPDIAAFNAARRAGFTRGRPLKTDHENLNHASTAIGVVLAADGEPPREIQLFPFGTVTGRDGRGPWTLADRAHAEEVIAATQALHSPTDMMVDYDHQALFAAAPGKGGTAEASGWIDVRTLTVREDGIWASVEWTADAAEKLRKRTYRYLSPYFGSSKTTGRLTRFFNVGLVNQPAIREIAAAASVDHQTQGKTEPMKTVLAGLGLKEDATEAEAAAAVAALQTAAQAGEQLTATATALGLKAGATGDEIVAAASAAVATSTPDPTKFVPIETYNAVAAKLQADGEARAAAAVDQAIEAGKIPPANRQWALDYFGKDEQGFAAFVQNQTSVVVPGAGKAAGKKADDGKVVLTDEQKQVCSMMGWDEAEYAKTLEQETAQ